VSQILWLSQKFAQLGHGQPDGLGGALQRGSRDEVFGGPFNLTASRKFLPGWRESAGAARASR
jgi:hypothetical protein